MQRYQSQLLLLLIHLYPHKTGVVLVFVYVVVLVKKMLVGVVIVYLVDDGAGLHVDIYLDHDEM